MERPNSINRHRAAAEHTIRLLHIAPGVEIYLPSTGENAEALRIVTECAKRGLLSVAVEEAGTEAGVRLLDDTHQRALWSLFLSQPEASIRVKADDVPHITVLRALLPSSYFDQTQSVLSGGVPAFEFRLKSGSMLPQRPMYQLDEENTKKATAVIDPSKENVPECSLEQVRTVLIEMSLTKDKSDRRLKVTVSREAVIKLFFKDPSVIFSVDALQFPTSNRSRDIDELRQREFIAISGREIAATDGLKKAITKVKQGS